MPAKTKNPTRAEILHGPVLLARITLHQNIGGKPGQVSGQLDVRRGANDELVLSMGNQSMSNMQTKTHPPAFCQERDAQTVFSVVHWIKNSASVVLVGLIEYGPSARQVTTG